MLRRIFSQMTLLTGVFAFSFSCQAGAQSLSANSQPTSGVTEVDPGKDSTSPNNLKDFLKLRQQLPSAVCDEVAASRPPTMYLPTGEELRPVQFFDLEVNLSEAGLISFLMEDAMVFMAASDLTQAWNSARFKNEAGLRALKERVSREICTAHVTPGRLLDLLEQKPGHFFRINPLRSKDLNQKKKE